MSDEKESQNKDTFWDEYKFQYNDKNDGYEFVNLVEVAEEFVRMVSIIARLGHELERLNQQKANLEVQKQRAERALNSLRRDILSDGLSDLAKTAKPQIIEAFIVEKAKANGTYSKICAEEKTIETVQKDLDVVQPRIDQVQTRQSAIKLKGEFLRQYLDYQKLQIRVEGNL